MDGMPPITKCDVEKCFYNRELLCHAPAINVGGDHPSCDTYIAENVHISRSNKGLVGACHVSQCRFNADLMCQASGIVVGNHLNHADCNTFDPK